MGRKVLAWLLLVSMTFSSFSNVGSLAVHAAEYDVNQAVATEEAATEDERESVEEPSQTEEEANEPSEEPEEETSEEIMEPSESLLTGPLEAEEESSDTYSNDGVPSGVSVDDLKVSARDGLGELLASELEGEVTEYSEEDNIVYSVEMENGVAKVAYRADYDCSLVIALLDETGKEMYTSEVTEVATDVTEIDVTMDMSNVSTYYLIRAYLIDTETLSPISKEYENNLYTREMQEFLSKDVSDFNEEQVINFDEDTQTNFAVVSDDVIVIDYAEGVNVVTKQDLENEEYVIENATDAFKNLQAGNIVLYDYNEFFIIIGVESISVDGNTVTIKGKELEAEDVFQHVRIDEVTDTSQMDYDPSTCGEEVTYEGLVENADEELLTAVEGESSITTAVKYTFGEKQVSETTKIKGSLELSVRITAKLYISFSKAYIEISGKTVGKTSIEINTKDALKIPLGFYDTMVGPVFIGFTPSFMVEASGTISWTGTYETGFVLKISTNGPKHVDLQTIKPVIKSEVKGEMTIFIGISLEPRIWMLTESFAKIEFEAKIGFEIKGTMKQEISTQQSEYKHLCSSCVTGDINFKIEAKAEATVLKWKESVKKEKKVKIADFYYSKDTNTFAFTTCPNNAYRCILTIKEKQTKKPIKDVKVALEGETNSYKTDKNGMVVLYLESGKHRMQATDTKNNRAAATISVKKTALTKTCYITLPDEASGEPGSEDPDEPGESSTHGEYATWKWSLDANGLLLIDGIVKGSDFWGNGEARAPWYEVEDDIKKCIVTGSGDGDLSYMFHDCNYLKELNVSNFDTGNVTSMRGMFCWCNSITSLDVSNFDTSEVRDMSYMFEYCNSITNLDLRSFDTRNVIDMGHMFYGCSSITSLDLRSFDTGNVTNMEDMFSSCNSITSLDLRSFDTGNVTNMEDMFYRCNSITSLDLRSFDTINVINMSYMFYGCSSITSLDLRSFDTGNVTNMEDMFYRCNSITSLDLSSFDTGNVTSMGEMFCGCDNLTSLNVSNFDTSKVTDMFYMFSGCNSIPSLDLSNFDISKVTDMSCMVSLCGSITKIKSPYNIAQNVYLPFSSRTTWIDESGTEVESMHQNLSYSVTYTRVDNTTSADASAAISISENQLCALAGNETEESTITKGENCYNIYVTTNSLEENELSKDNLKYIVQATTDTKDVLCEELKTTYPDAFLYVASMYKTSIETATVTVGELVYKGTPLIPVVKVTMDGKELIQGKDYDIYGDLLVDKAGTYGLTVYGMGDYCSTVETTCKVQAGITYTICFSGNGATGGSMTKLTNCIADTAYTLPANTYKRTGYLFNGWNTKENGSGTAYSDKGKVQHVTIQDNGVLTLYAQWKPITYTIKFDKNGGRGTMSKATGKKYNSTYKLSANHFQKSGYAFAGWNTKKNGKGKTYKNRASVKNLSTVNGKTITLYAQWKKVKVAQAGKPTIKNTASNKLIVTCKRVTGAKGYEIQYATNKGMKKGKKVYVSGTKKTIKGLKKGTTYYVRVRAYKVDSAGKKIYGKYSKVQHKKITK